MNRGTRDLHYWHHAMHTGKRSTRNSSMMATATPAILKLRMLLPEAVWVPGPPGYSSRSSHVLRGRKGRDLLAEKIEIRTMQGATEADLRRSYGKPLQALIAGLQKSQQPVSIDAATATPSRMAVDGGGFRIKMGIGQCSACSIGTILVEPISALASQKPHELKHPSQTLAIFIWGSMPISRRNQAGPARL